VLTPSGSTLRTLASDTPRQKEVKEPINAVKPELTEAQLWAEYTTTKSDEARGELFRRFHSVALKFARSYYSRKMPAHSSANCDDLEQAASVGLLEAIGSYSPDKGTNFQQYAYKRISGSIIDCLRAHQHYPRSISKNRRELKPLIARVATRLQKPPTTDEICEHVGEWVRPILEDPLYKTGVFTQVKSTDENGNLIDVVTTIQCSGTTRKDPLSRIELERAILGVIKDRCIRKTIWLYYWWNIPFKRIARFEKCSMSTIANRHATGIAILKEHFTYAEFRDIVSDK